MLLAFRSPVTKPLLRKGTPKPVPPDPRAYDTFRVTQQFSDRDFYHNDGRLHNATDIGNFRCGDPIVAMAAGNASRVSDGAGALGIRIDHGYGVTSEYWHLNRQDASGPVKAGAQIGLVGSTGLGSVCHCHIEVKRDGTRIDPEPLIFGGSLNIATGEDDVKIKGRFLRHVQNARTELTVDSHFRAGVLAGDDESLSIFARGTVLYPIVTVEGRAVGTAGDRAEWHGALAYVASAYHFGYVHSSVVGPFEPIQAADCSALENRLDGIAAAAEGLGQAAAAIVELAKR